MNDKFDNLIEKFSKAYSVNPTLVKAVIWQESNGDPDAVSYCDARGLMQIMPTTGEGLGVKKADDLFKPEVNIEAGTRYLAQLFDRFPEIPGIAERWKFALASYNGGRGHINKALRAAREAKVRFWYKWENAKKFLVKCDVNQIVHYVDGVTTKMLEYFLKPKPPKVGGLFSVIRGFAGIGALILAVVLSCAQKPMLRTDQVELVPPGSELWIHRDITGDPIVVNSDDWIAVSFIENEERKHLVLKESEDVE